MTLAPRRTFGFIQTDDHMNDDELDLLELQQHSEVTKPTIHKSAKKLGKRGRPPGSTKGAADIASEQKGHRKMVLRALPELSFDIRRQASTYRDRISLKPKVLSASSIKNIHHLIGEILDESMRQEHARSAVEYILATNQKDPVVEYLNTCRGRSLDMSWGEITQRIFKTDEQLAADIFKKWMVGTAKRPLQPGCVMDWLMILVGAQGIGKSAFGRSLIPTADWYGELSADVDMLVKEPSRMQMSWINELAEVDSMTCGRKSDREKMKNLVSIREDITRLPYAPHPERVPRAFAFYGNTNRSEFITDVESRRTFMIQIPEGETIDFEWVAANRDGLWAKALAEIDAGTSCTWTRNEYEQVHEKTMQFRVEDPIEQLLDEFLATRNKVSIQDIIRGVLQVPPHMQELSHSRRVSELMRARGWQKYTTSKKQDDGRSKSVRAFKRPANQLQANELSDY